MNSKKKHPCEWFVYVWVWACGEAREYLWYDQVRSSTQPYVVARIDRCRSQSFDQHQYSVLITTLHGLVQGERGGCLHLRGSAFCAAQKRQNKRVHNILWLLLYDEWHRLKGRPRWLFRAATMRFVVCGVREEEAKRNALGLAQSWRSSIHRKRAFRA
jgi:hypothetical protein